MNLQALSKTYAICRLDPQDPIPEWALRGEFFSLSKTPEELSIVCPEENVPASSRAERNRRCFRVAGTLDFGMTGILSALAEPLAETSISIFAVSTFDTDYLLVEAKDFDRAVSVLTSHGHKFI